MMGYTKRHNRKKPAHSQDQRLRENPRLNVVSLRMTDDEKSDLQRMVQSSSKTVSEILREALALLVTSSRKHCLHS